MSEKNVESVNVLQSAAVDARSSKLREILKQRLANHLSIDADASGFSDSFANVQVGKALSAQPDEKKLNKKSSVKKLLNKKLSSKKKLEKLLVKCY